MHIQTYTHILHVWAAWIKIHRRQLLGGTFAILACVHTAMISDQLTDAYVLLHFKESDSVALYLGERSVDRKAVVFERTGSSSSVSSALPEGIHPAASDIPHDASSESSASSSSPPSAPASSSVSSDQAFPSSASSASAEPDFPAFGHAVMPVSKVPDWGNMRTPEEWNRPYGEMGPDDFVSLPSYDIGALTSRTMEELKETRNDPETVRLLTLKLTWSTRFFGAYDLDASEFTAVHPGIDIKLALNTPVGAVAGGRVQSVIRKQTGLGLHVIIEHRTDAGERFYSIYGHLGSVKVSEGDDVKPGQTIGFVGMTGKTTAPHLHLQIDRGNDAGTHVPYWPFSLPGRSEAARSTVHPVEFIRSH